MFFIRTLATCGVLEPSCNRDQSVQFDVGRTFVGLHDVITTKVRVERICVDVLVWIEVVLERIS